MHMAAAYGILHEGFRRSAVRKKRLMRTKAPSGDIWNSRLVPFNLVLLYMFYIQHLYCLKTQKYRTKPYFVSISLFCIYPSNYHWVKLNKTRWRNLVTSDNKIYIQLQLTWYWVFCIFDAYKQATNISFQYEKSILHSINFNLFSIFLP